LARSPKPVPLVRGFVVPSNESCRGAMPARFAVLESLALAGAVHAVNLVRVRENEERVTVKVHERVRFDFLFCFRYGCLPSKV